MVYLLGLIISSLLVTFFLHPISSCQSNFNMPTNVTSNSIPFTTRAYWIRETIKLLLDPPCPFAAFATVIVNHTESGLGKLVCTGINQNSLIGNPTLHGEMVAIDNCSKIFTAENGSYRLSPEEALSAFSQLSLYTNGESCPMVSL